MQTLAKPAWSATRGEGRRLRRAAPLGPVSLMIASCATAGGAGLSGATAGADAGASSTDPGGSFTRGADAATCPGLPPPPAGAQCVCNWDHCQTSSLTCACSESCVDPNGGCLIVLGSNGQATSSNPVLSACMITCTQSAENLGGLTCQASDCTGQGEAGPEAAPVTPPEGGSGACPVPVPGPTIITQWIAGLTNFHFKIPFSDWALAAAHVWLRLPQLHPYKEHLDTSPSFYFATGMVETFWGCSLRLPPFDPANAGLYFMQWVEPLLPDGCLAISLGASSELEDVFPQVFDGVRVTHDSTVSSVDQVALGRDNIVSSIHTKAYVDLVNYALLVEEGAPDPDAWFAGAADPWAKDEMIAQMYNQGPYNGNVQSVLLTCQKQPSLQQGCIGQGLQYVTEVTATTRELEASVAAGNCYDDPIGHDDIAYYIDKLTALYVDEDATAITSAAMQAFDDAAQGQAKAPFQQVALPVLEAIEGAMKTKLYCPDATLSTLWNKRCPM